MADITNFRMPRSAEIPSIGLYLEQTTKYLNEVFAPLSCVELTPSMISNYVKKRYIDKPVKKLYSREQIRSLIFIALAKLVLSMDNIDLLIKSTSDGPVDDETYDAFCDRFERTLFYVFGAGEKTEETERSDGGDLGGSMLIAIANCVYLNERLNEIRKKEEAAAAAAKHKK